MVRWLLQDRWLSSIPLQVPPLSLLLYSDAPLGLGCSPVGSDGLGGVWSVEENSMHIIVLDTRAVSLALAAFLSQLLRLSVVLMSDNALVVAYLRHQGSTISRVLASHGLGNRSLDQAAFGLPVCQVHSGEKEHSGRPARPS